MNLPPTTSAFRRTTIALLGGIVALGAMACGPVSYDQDFESPLPSDYGRPGPSELAEYEYAPECFFGGSVSGIESTLYARATQLANEGWRVVNMVSWGNNGGICLLAERPVDRTPQPELDRMPRQPLVGEPSNP